MAETYLNLLNSAAAVSAKVYEQIDSSMTQRLNIEAQAGKFQADAMAKAGQFAEQQRMNDEQIMNMRAGNYMQAQKLEVDKMLMPIRLETENLKLESQRLALQRQKESEGKAYFNSLTSIYDDQIGYSLLQTESTEMAQEYLGYKARVGDYVSKGGKFQSGEFEKGLAEIRSKYSAIRPSKEASVEYNTGTHLLLEQVSPKLGAIYAKNHPAIKGSRNSMVAAFYDADGKGVSEFANMASMYDNAEIGQAWIGRRLVQTNKQNIKEWNEELSKSRSNYDNGLAHSADPAQLEGYKSSIALYNTKIKEAMDQNELLYKNASMGKYGAPEGAKPEVQESPKVTLTDISGNTEPTTRLGVPPAEFPAMQKDLQQVNDAVGNTQRALSSITKDAQGKEVLTPIEKTEISQVDLSWAKGDAPTLGAKANVKEMIERGVSKMVGDRSANIGAVATPEKIKNLLETIDTDVEIPVSRALDRILRENNQGAILKSSRIKEGEESQNLESYDATIGGVRSAPTVKFGPKGNSMFGGGKEGVFQERNVIRSADDLFEVINNIKHSTKKNVAMRELYEALATASLTGGATRKEDR